MNAEMDITKNQWRSTGGESSKGRFSTEIISNILIVKNKFFLQIELNISLFGYGLYSSGLHQAHFYVLHIGLIKVNQEMAISSF